MQVVEIDKDRLLNLIQTEIDRLEAQHRYNDTFWNLLQLEITLKDLYKKARV